VKSINIIPSNINAGDNVELSIQIDNRNNTITSGFIHYTIEHDGDEYEPQVDDLCSFVKCPIDKGLKELSLKFKMPFYLEQIHLYVELMDYNNRSFVCGRINAKLDLWSWIKSWFVPRPNQPIVDVRRSLRGYEKNIDIVNQSIVEQETDHLTKGKATAGMRPSISSSVNA
jgi:hypothetical protein